MKKADMFKLFFPLFLVFLIFGCGTESPVPSVSSVAVVPSTASIRFGATLMLTPVVTVVADASKDVKWQSNDTTIAVVSSVGVVTGKAVGSALIKAVSTVDTTKVASSHVIVTGTPSIGAVTVNVPIAKVQVNQTVALFVAVGAVDGASTDVTWWPENSEIATVDTNGVVTGVREGSTTIQVTSVFDATKFTEVMVIVEAEPAVLFVRVDMDTILVEKDAEKIIIPMVTSTGGASTDVIFSSSNPQIVTVDTNGVIRGAVLGQATITVTSRFNSTKTTTVNVKVVPVSLIESVTITPPTTNFLIVDSMLALTAVVVSTGAIDKTVRWSSSNNEVAEVTEEGVVTGLKVGMVTITARSNLSAFKSGSVTLMVTVPAKVDTIILTAITSILAVGGNTVLDAEVIVQGQALGTVSWLSSDTTIARVENGIVTGIALGNVNIKVTSNFDTTKSAQISFTIESAEILSIMLDSVVNIVIVDSTLTLGVLINATGGALVGVTWSTNDITIATVDANGVVTGIGVGTAMIRVTSVFDSTKFAEKLVTVIEEFSIRAEGLLTGLAVTEIINDTNVIHLDESNFDQLNTIFVGGFNSSETEGLLYESGGEGTGITFGYKNGAFLVSVGSGRNIDAQVTGLSNNTSYVYIIQILINNRIDIWVTEGATISQITGSADATETIIGLLSLSGSNPSGYLSAQLSTQYPLEDFHGIASDILFFSNSEDITPSVE